MSSDHAARAAPRAVVPRPGVRSHRGEGFTAREHVAAPPVRLLQVLSDPEAIQRWFPVACEFEDHVERLCVGERYPVRGRLAGRAVHVELTVHEASEQRVRVALAGPVVFALDVELSPDGTGTWADIAAAVHSGGGLSGRLLATAAGALLRAGALGHTVAAIRAEAEAPAA